MRLTDSHVHFWDPERFRYVWLDEQTLIRRRFGLEEFAAASSAFEVETLIFLQADCLPEQGSAEVEWVKELAAIEPRLRGAVAFAALEDPAAAEAAVARWSGDPVVCGLRRLIQPERPGFCQQPEFRSGVRRLAESRLRFDLCCRGQQLPEVVALVEACPGVRFVLDHFGKPDIRGGQTAPWKEQLRNLASAGDVACKLSGLVTEADPLHWTREELQPWVDAALEVFGPRRMLFGSDWPVCTLASSYRRWVETARDCLAGLSEDERDDVFRRNALRVYGIETGVVEGMEP
ncbi:MAG TPA: amidohydrolase family protein [Verrucomicrobiales bacterium]|nr:amidohydrolase family protein [Verrucomicrobiales bacterium]